MIGNPEIGTIHHFSISKASGGHSAYNAKLIGINYVMRLRFNSIQLSHHKLITLFMLITPSSHSLVNSNEIFIFVVTGLTFS